MKFKTIFIIFNIVIVCSFLFIFFMPLILLGGQHFGTFFLKNWFIGVLFVFTLAIFNFYFLRNWKLFQLLEKEDWQSLTEFLQKRIYNDTVTRQNYVRILINAYLVTSNTEAIAKLETFLSEKKPRLVRQFAIQFGIPYLLINRPEESEKYFGKLLTEKGLRNAGWIRWNYAFSLLQLKELVGARKEFTTIIRGKKDPVLLLLSLYMLNSLKIDDIMLRAQMDEKINEFKKANTRENWDRKIERAKGNIQVLILSKIIKEASDWVFQQKPIAESDSVH